MKAALKPRSWVQAQPKPPAQAADKLASIKIRDYSLIGFRDHEAESETQNQLLFLYSNAGIRMPRLYTLVSQNRKITIKENLSSTQRFFLNFESFKWSELFFKFFRQIVSPNTEHFVFQHLLYSLDIYVCQFQLITMFVKNSSKKINGALQRRKRQLEFISLLKNHPQRDKLFLLLIFELVLVCMGKNQYTTITAFVTNAEAQILLNYFSSEGVIALESDELSFSPEKLPQALRKYFDFRGQILFTKNSKNVFSDKRFQQFKNIFEEKETVLEHRVFETCFTHA